MEGVGTGEFGVSRSGQAVVCDEQLFTQKIGKKKLVDHLLLFIHQKVLTRHETFREISHALSKRATLLFIRPLRGRPSFHEEQSSHLKIHPLPGLPTGEDFNNE